jgi:hypothetical protein
MTTKTPPMKTSPCGMARAAYLATMLHQRAAGMTKPSRVGKKIDRRFAAASLKLLALVRRYLPQQSGQRPVCAVTAVTMVAAFRTAAPTSTEATISHLRMVDTPTSLYEATAHGAYASSRREKVAGNLGGVEGAEGECRIFGFGETKIISAVQTRMTSRHPPRPLSAGGRASALGCVRSTSRRN